MFHCKEELHFGRGGTPTRLVFPFRVWLDNCVSVDGLGIEVSASTFMLFRCMCLVQRVSEVIKTKNIENKKFDVILQPFLTFFRKLSELWILCCRNVCNIQEPTLNLH